MRAAYAPAGLVWMAPLGFDNTFALVVRPDAGVRTISQAVGPARAWTAAFGYEFKQRPDGFPALERVYGLAFRDVRTMDLGLLYRALADRQADVGVGSATDAQIDFLGFVMLEDDRHAFPPYEAVPVVRQAALDRHPGLQAALEGLGGRLSAETMRRLNRRWTWTIAPRQRSPGSSWPTCRRGSLHRSSYDDRTIGSPACICTEKLLDCVKSRCLYQPPISWVPCQSIAR